MHRSLRKARGLVSRGPRYRRDAVPKSYIFAFSAQVGIGYVNSQAASSNG